MRKLLGLWTLVGLSGFLALSGPAHAAPITWTYAEGGYNNVDIDSINDDGNGWFLGGSFGMKNFHFFGRYTDSSTDQTSTDVKHWFAGAGWHGMLGDSADVLGELAYSHGEVGSVDDNGYFVRGGVRWRPIGLFEMGGFVRYEDLGDLDSNMVYEANVMIHFWRIGLGASYETQDDADTYNIFARFNFGRN